MHDPRLLLMSSFLVDSPFADRRYPGALDPIVHLRPLGPDRHPIGRQRGLPAARGPVFLAVGSSRRQGPIYLRKEQRLDDLQQRYPAHHDVMVEDRLRILAAMKERLHDRLSTVFPRRRNDALDPQNLSAYPPADLAIEHIGDLLDYDFPALLNPARVVGGIQETT